MKITKRQLRRVIRQTINESQTAGPPISGDHAIALGGSYHDPRKEDQTQSAFDSGMSDAQEGYEAGSYHDWIEGNPELMDAYDAGYEEGLETPTPLAPADLYKRSAEDMQRIYGDMDVGVRGKAGY